jgi:hypothetical protein
METMVGQPGFRASFDLDMMSGMSGMGDETGLGRRLDFMGTLARNNSLPATDFPRERVTSFSNYMPMVNSSNPGKRNRFSIAVPPDQTTTTFDTFDLNDEFEMPPSKRIRTDIDSSLLLAIDIVAKDFVKYYAFIHPQFTLLPDSAGIAANIASMASITLKHALLTTIDLFPNLSTDGNDQSKAEQDNKSGIRDIKDMSLRLSEAYHEIATPADALVFVWVCVLLLVSLEYAVDSYDTSFLDPIHLTNQACDVLEGLSNAEAPGYLLKDAEAQGYDMAALREMTMRARCMAIIQRKLFHLGTTLAEYSENLDFPATEDIEAANIPNQQLKFLAYTTEILTYATQILRRKKYTEHDRREKNMLLRCMEMYGATKADLDTSSPIFQQVTEYLKVLLARTIRFSTNYDALWPAAKLAEKLTVATKTYSPLDMHLYTVCVLSFLEVLSLPPALLHADGDFAPPLAITGLASIRPALQEMAAHWAANRSVTNKEFWGKVVDSAATDNAENGGGEEDGTAGTANKQQQPKKDVVKKSWMQTLLQHIEAREANGWATSLTTKLEAEGNLAGGGVGVAVGLAVGNFSWLLDRGYLVILRTYAARMVEREMESS